MIQRKIIISYIIVILIGSLITGIFSYQVAHERYIKEVEKNLMTVGYLIEDELLTFDDSLDLNDIAIRYGKVTNMRITFIDELGNVLGDSSQDYSQMENHGDRREFIDALKYGHGESTRYSSSLETHLKYIALKVVNNDETMIIRLSIPIDDINVIKELIKLYIISGVIISIIASMAMGIQFSIILTKPIKKLTKLTKDISQGNFKGKLDINSNDEIGQLAQSFTHMQMKLDKTINELNERNIEMEAILDSMVGGLIALDLNNQVMMINPTAIEMFDINNKKIIGEDILLVIRDNVFNQFIKNHDELTIDQRVMDIKYEDKDYKIFKSKIINKLNDDKLLGTLIIIQDITDLKKLEQIRSEFVSNVTHELKTPLTSIRGFIDTLKNGAMEDKDVAEKFLDIIDIEAERLSILIEDILNLSEIETMKEDIYIGEYILKDIIGEVKDIILPVAEKKNVTLDFTIIPDDTYVKVNKNRLKQLLINLIDNGIKYNKENGSVSITCKKIYNIIEFSIKDTGIGVSDKDIPRLFERFYRVDKGRSRTQGGTGLGLSIVKHIVNLYDGNMEVKSREGEGTEFIIKLPIVL